jgi:hypothetical protein
MFASLRAQFAAMSPRYRRLLLVALGLSLLLVLNRTAVRWVLDYEGGIDSRIEDLEAQLRKAEEKIASHGTLIAKRQALQGRLAEEDRLLLPFNTPNEAQNMLSSCLTNLSVKTGVELTNVVTKSVVDLGEHYQKVEVVARTNALTQNWTRFLYEIEALRDKPATEEDPSGCPALPLTVEEMTVRMPLGQNQHTANLMFDISGIIRKPLAPEASGGAASGSPAAQPRRGA